MTSLGIACNEPMTYLNIAHKDPKPHIDTGYKNSRLIPTMHVMKHQLLISIFDIKNQ